MKTKMIHFSITILSILIINGCSLSDIDQPADQSKEITIGSLLSLTGNWSTLGITSKAALELAVNEINQKFENEGIKLKFKLKIIDTKLDPEIAYNETQKLINEGIEIIIGPQSSSELTRIKPLLDANNIFAVSMGSTAGSLALSGDHVLRFCPDDKPEGIAISELMWSRGIRKVLAVYRDDDGNISLKRSMENHFSGLGGLVIDSVKYSSDDNITPDLVNEISSILKNENDPSQTAVYLAGFDEIAQIFTLASADSVLKSTLFFGSNGSAGSEAVISDMVSAQFANLVEFCSPQFALSNENEDDWSAIAQSILHATNLNPDAYTFAAYDALQVAAQAYVTIGNNYQFGELFSGFVNIAAAYKGLTGITELNAAGDRKYGNFTFMGVCPRGPSYGWIPVGSYNTESGLLLFDGCR